MEFSLLSLRVRIHGQETPGEGTPSMKTARHRQPSLARRRLADRRAHPTTLGRALRWRGRRKRFPRAAEGHQAYVDCLARRVVWLAVLIHVCSLRDALLTLRHLHAGGDEANPRPAG